MTVWTIALALACATGVSTSSLVPTQPPSTPNVLLITVDTLRADRLGSYGHTSARTPVLDALAAAGVRFADATAHAPLTHPSHAAILSGRYPGAYGIRLNGMDPLPSSAVTLAERLKATGYRTGAVTASVVLDSAHGLDQGFDDYDDAIAGPVRATMAMADLQRSATEVIVGGGWLDQPAAGAVVPLGALLRSAPAVLAPGAPSRGGRRTAVRR